MTEISEITRAIKSAQRRADETGIKMCVAIRCDYPVITKARYELNPVQVCFPRGGK